MKKKLILMGVAAALVTATLIGGSLAYFQATGQRVKQQINTKNLGIQFNEVGKDGSGKDIYTQIPNGTVYVKEILPGAEIQKEVCITNTQNTDLYTRITISKYWGSFKGSEFIKDGNKIAEKIKIPAVQDKDNSGDKARWILQKEDNEQMVLYYTKPLAPGENSKIFMDLIQISQDLQNDYADLGIELKMQADAVQILAGQDAIMSEWGVLATIDDQGYITKIEE